MPEIGEVARVVHFLRKHLVGRTIARVTAEHDDIVYGKVGTSAAAFKEAMTGKKVLGAKQQGKYFWLEMSSPPHPLMHLGMNGWVRFSNDESAKYKKAHHKEWPPRYMKFMLHLNGEPDCEVAFVDSRRLGRIRLIDVAADQMRKTTPLKENGPDPVIDKDILTVDWLAQKMRSKKVPVKALMLDQKNMSGVGNWVADEVLYNARIHPEQYSNTFSDSQIQDLHKSLMYVCNTACDLLADSSKFPEDWLMKHRWGKGRKKDPRLPNGDKIVHITVGGRTSAVVLSRQKKTGPVAGETIVEEADGESNGEDNNAAIEEGQPKPKRGKAKAKPVANGKAASAEAEPEPKPKRGRAKAKDSANGNGENPTAVSSKPGRSRKVKAEQVDAGDQPTKTQSPAKSRKRKMKAEEGAEEAEHKPAKRTKQPKEAAPVPNGTSRRRSARLSR